MYAVARELQPAHGVTHAVRGRFGPTPTAQATVFARKNSLENYVVRTNAEHARLLLLTSTPLSATVVSMAVARRPAAASDLLAVAFAGMRIALLAWDPHARAWRTDQLIDLASMLGTAPSCNPPDLAASLDPTDRGRPLLRGSRAEDPRPLMRADPTGRCLAVLSRTLGLFYIIPLRTDDDDARDAAESERFAARNAIFTIDLPTAFEAPNVKDFSFLHGTFDPAIAVLHEPKRTWSGRAAVQRNTCALLNISIDLRQKLATKSWLMDSFPYDCERVEPVPEAAEGGVLVISPNALIQVRHGRVVAGLSLNFFGDAYAADVKEKYDTITQSDVLVECDAAHCRFLDVEDRAAADHSPAPQGIALLSLKGGELYFLHVAAGAQNKISMKRTGSTVIASEIIPVNHRFFILSSRLSDSLLVEFKRVDDASEDIKDGTADDTLRVDSNGRKEGAGENGDRNGTGSDTEKRKKKSDGSRPKKRKRTAEEDAEYEMIYGVKPPQESSDEDSDEEDQDQSAFQLEAKDEGTRGVYDDEDELGFVFNDDSGSGKTSGPGNWALKVKDTLQSFGPGADVTTGPSPEDISQTQLDLVVAGGYAKNGCLAVVHQTIRPAMYTEFEMPGCNGVWTLLDPSHVRKEQARRKKANTATVERNSKKRARNEGTILKRKRYVERAIEELKEQNLALRKKKAEEKAKRNTDEGKHISSEVKKEEQAKEDDENLEHDNRKENGLEDGKDIEKKNEAESNKLKNTVGGDDLPKTTSLSVDEADKSTEQNSVHTHPNEEGKGQKTFEIEQNGSVKKESVETSVDKEDKPHPERDPTQPEDPSKEENMNIDNEGAPEKKNDDDVGEREEEESKEDGEEIEINEDIILQMEQQAESTLPLEEEEPLEEGPPDENAMHGLMLLNSTNGTTVLTTAADLEEAAPGSTDFSLNEKTLVAGNAFLNEAIVQVVASKVRVLKEGRLQCEYLIESGAPRIVRAQISEPLILLEMEDKSAKVLRISAEQYLAEESNELDDEEIDPFGESRNTSEDKETFTSYRNFSISVDFSESGIVLGEGTKISCAFLYKGIIASKIAADGILTYGLETATAINEPDEQGGINGVESTEESGTVANPEEKDEKKEEMEIDDEDRLLYGDQDDEEDKMLYGDGGTNEEVTSNTLAGGQEDQSALNATQPAAPGAGNGDTAKVHSGPVVLEKGVLPMVLDTNDADKAGHLLVVVTEEGSLMVLCPALDYSVVLECPYMYAAPSLITDHPVLQRDTERLGEFLPAALPEYWIDRVALTEIQESCLLPGLSNPYLIVIPRSNVPLIYQAYLPNKVPSQSPCRSKLTFRRICFNDATAHILAKSMKASMKFSGARTGSKPSKITSIHQFQNISGRSGLFLGGAASAFLFAERGYPRLHEMCLSKQQGAISREEYESGLGITSISEFHNRMCPRGFIYVDGNEVVRIASLAPATQMNFDAPAPFRKIPLRCTPHKVAFHAGSSTYGVLASMPTLTSREERMARILDSLQKHDKRHFNHVQAQVDAETSDNRTERVPPLFEELHELRVYRPDTWELIKSHKLQKGEVGLAICNMQVNVFKQKKAGSGMEIPNSNKDEKGDESFFAASLRMRPKDLLVVGTGILNGEDSTSKGRLLLFEVSRQEVYTDAIGGHTAFQLRLIASKDLFSPVTAVAPMEGYIIAGVGPQVSVYKLVDDQIVHLSFAFGQLFCTSISTLKQYVIAADMWKSVTFMYFRERNNSVNFLGRDYDTVATYTNEFLIENANMSIIVSDGNENLRLLNYAHASVAESRGGKRLLLNGATNIGSRVNKFLRVRMPDRAGALRTGIAQMTAGQHALLFGTLDGGVGAVVSVSEDSFKELQRIWEVLFESEGLGRMGGVNMSEQTAFKHDGAPVEMLGDRIMDSRLVFELFSLPSVEMRLAARKAGLDMARVVDLLLELDEVVYRF